MTPRMRYILGGALMGAILGAIYANYLYSKTAFEDIDVMVERYTDADIEKIKQEEAVTQTVIEGGEPTEDE